MADGDDGDGDGDLPGKQTVEHDSSDVDPLRLPHVAVDSSTTRTTRNPDWCNSDRSLKRLSPW